MLQSSFDYNPIGVFLAFFREMIGDLGEFDEILTEVDYVWLLYGFFFVATILLTIAMMNLLIAIISDTFSRVKNAENLTKIWERWNIITEIDEMLFEKNQGKKIDIPQDNKFLLFLYNDCHFKKEANETDFQNSMDEFKAYTKQNFEKLEEFKTKTDENFEKMEEESKINNEKNVKKLEEFRASTEKSLEKIFMVLNNFENNKKWNKME